MADDNELPKRPIRLSLEAADKVVRRGDTPRFKLTIRNEGKKPERVLKLRGDLQDTYYDLEVTQWGKDVSIPRAISDPGPITEEDFLQLRPGEKVTFELTRFAAALSELPPGKYLARIRFWQDPHQSGSIFFSPSAEFTVR